MWIYDWAEYQASKAAKAAADLPAGRVSLDAIDADVKVLEALTKYEVLK